MFCWEAGVHCVHVRFDLHRSQVTGQFLCTLRYPYLQSINKENKVRVLKFYYSIDLLASDINLQAYPNHRITRGGSFKLGFIDSRGAPTFKSQSFLRICDKGASNPTDGDAV